MKAEEILNVIKDIENKERIKLLKALSEKYFGRKPTTDEVADLIAE